MTTVEIPGITQLAEPCWVIRNADGTELEGEFDPHYRTEASAREMLGEPEDGDGDPQDGGGEIVTQQLTPCWTATAACGLAFDRDGEGYRVHQPDRDEMVAAVEDADWDVRPDGTVLCVGGRCACAAIASADEAPGEVDGQQGLPI